MIAEGACLLLPGRVQRININDHIYVFLQLQRKKNTKYLLLTGLNVTLLSIVYMTFQ